jgi:hypothetical protein
LVSNSCDDIFVVWRFRSLKWLVQTESRTEDDCFKVYGDFAKESTIINCCVLEVEETATNTAWSIYWVRHRLAL